MDSIAARRDDMKNCVGILVVALLFAFSKSNSQTITTVAGTGVAAHSGDGGAAATANIYYPIPGVFDSRGNLYFVEFGGAGNRIRKIDVSGTITTVAGTASSGYNGDGIIATNAQLRSPSAVVVDASDNIFICDHDNNRIRKVDIATGVITTVAGNGTSGYSGDNGAATNAQLKGPTDICFDKHGNLFIGDVNNYRVRKVDLFGTITTYAGNGSIGCGGDFGAATAAEISPSGLCVDDSDNLYISDATTGENRIAKVNAVTGIITTIAGTCVSYLYNGDGIPATSANINPSRIRFDKTYEGIYFTDVLNNRIRRVNSAGYIYNVAGNGVQGFSGDGGPALTAALYYPSGVTFDSCNNLFFGDSYNHRIRKVAFNPDCLPISVQDVKSNEAISVTLHPNPATETLTITAGVAIESVSVMNVMGQIVATSPRPSPRPSLQTKVGTGKEREVLLNISHLPPGVYMVRVNEAWTGKFVKE